MLIISDVYNKDGATCRVVAEGEAWSDPIILGILGIFPVYPDWDVTENN